MKLTQVLEKIGNDGKDTRLSIGGVVKSIESRGFGPLLLAPCLIVLLPTGAIPTIPTLCGVTICLIAGQLAFGKKHPWLPGRLEKVKFHTRTYRKGLDTARPWTRRIDALTHPRFQWLINPVAERMIALWCIVLALAMIPLELLPFAAFIPALAITFIALGLSARDGLFTVLGLTISAGLVLAAPSLYHAIATR